jgi:ADP-ribosylglycohydrolase
MGKSKQAILQWATETFGYDLSISLDEVRESYRFDVSCQGTMPWAFRALLEGQDFEDTIRLAVSIGGDSDTLACIAGSMAEALYGSVPNKIVLQITPKFESDIAKVVDAFRDRYIYF